MLHDLGILRWLTSAGPGANQHQTSDQLRMPKRERLGHISANREPEEIDLREAKRMNEVCGVFRHRINGVWRLTT